MSYYIIIRGPLGCGKTTVAKSLSKKLGAKMFSVDRILHENDLRKEWEGGYISQNSFRKSNEIIIPKAKKLIEIGIPIIIEGNFYWKSHIEYLIDGLNFPHYIFTLKAPLETCIRRDKNRNKIHDNDAVKAVFKKSTGFDYGKVIDTENKDVKETIKEILEYIKRN